MVKPDVKHNYYADLDLPAAASIEDVRKAYRKLALQYHPDRNAGKEEECVPRFQAIQAANEVLSDPTIKAKYDQDRRKSGTFPTFTKTPAPTGNPYQASSAYPPPPRRTQPGQWQRPQPSYPNGPTGAERFSNFPKPSSTPPRSGPAADRTQQFYAWQNLNTQSTRAYGGSANRRSYAQEQAQTPPPPPPRSPNPQAPNTGRPRPERKDTKMPTEEQIRAGMRHGTTGAADGPAAEKQSAWQAFNKSNASKQGMPRERTRRAAPTTPKRSGGFDPNMPGSDERPAPHSTGHYAPRNHSDDIGKDRYPPPPPGPPPPPTTNPGSPTSPQAPSQRPFANPPWSNKSRAAEEDVPYAEGNRTSTPYSSFIGERTQFSSESLRRSASTRDTSRLNQEDANRPSRARSQSPLRRQQQTHGASTGQSNMPGIDSDSSNETNDGSSDTSSDTPDFNQPPAEVDKAADLERPSTASINTNSFQPLPTRKMKKPTPPSSKLNGSNVFSNAETSQPDSSKSRAQSDGDQPSMQQRASGFNMYATRSFTPVNVPLSFSREKWVDESFGSLNTYGNRREARIPLWAIPSSVLPATHARELNRGFHASDEITELSREELESLRNDPLWKRTPADVRKAYCMFRAKLQESYGLEEEFESLNIELFLRLLVRFMMGEPIGHSPCRHILHNLSVRFASLNDASKLLALANSPSSSNSFNVPSDPVSNVFRSSPSKARSVESFDTQFSPGGFSGTFEGSPEYFSTTGRRPSPARRHPSSRGVRAATTDGTPTSTPGDMGPPPRPDGTSQPLTFSEEEWKKTFKDASWTWAPDSKAGSRPPSKTPSRQNSHLHSQTSDAELSKAGSKEQPHLIDEDDEVNQVYSRDKAQEINDCVADEGDAMDIDTPPHTGQSGTAAQESTPATQEPRLYSFPKSAWREQQEKQHKPWPASQQTASGESDLKTNLDNLSHVEPFARNTEGLRNLADLSSTLPFSSEAATAHSATKSHEPEKLGVPPIPKVPEVPSRWSKTTWHSYATSFKAYISYFHAFNKTMLAHFEARQSGAEALFQRSTNWLEANGDTSDELGFGNYLKGVREDEQVRETWNLGCERHLEAVKAFDKLREHVRKLAASGSLIDV